MKRFFLNLTILTSFLLIQELSLKAEDQSHNLQTPKFLQECPKSPNCVSSQTTQENKKMQPLQFSSKLSILDVSKIINSTMSTEKRINLIKSDPTYFHFIQKSFLFRFIDDIEFLIDEENRLIHFKSSSRTGHSDLGVNRKRMERISQKLDRALKEKANLAIK